MSLHKLISGSEFCRKNHGHINRKHFYEEYYRILHTAYLSAGECSCIEIIKEEFEDTFGNSPDSSSVTFILATAKYLADDDVISKLHADGALDSKYNYQRLVIEIGFDVWLLMGMDKKRKFKRKDFFQWLPLSKSDRTELAVKEFWNLRLPKIKDYKYLYERLLPYRSAILNCYNKLLLKNSYPEDDREAFNRILHYLKNELPEENPYSLEMAMTVQSCLQNTDSVSLDSEEASSFEKEFQGINPNLCELQTKADENSQNTSSNIRSQEPDTLIQADLNIPIYDTDELLLDSILDVDEAAQDVSVPAIDPIKKTYELNHWDLPKKIISSEAKRNSKNINTSARGFCCDKRILTKNKLQTAAKCVIIAGVCLIPLIAYQCLKKR